MQIEPALIVAVIAVITAFVPLVGGGIWWASKLTARVSRLESDVEELKKNQSESSDWRNRHQGQHEGRDGI